MLKKDKSNVFYVTFLLLSKIWLKGDRETKTTVILSIVCLLLSVVASVLYPLLYKYIINSLNIKTSLYVSIPLLLIFTYFIVKLLSSFFNELKTMIFIKLSQQTARILSLDTFSNTIALSMDYLTAQQIGKINRIISRGSKAVEFILNIFIGRLLNMLLELIFLSIVILIIFNVYFLLIILAMIVAYVAFSLLIAEKRMKYQITLNKHDNMANSIAIDALNNIEAVKSFTNEDLEKNNLNKALKRYQDISVRMRYMFGILNFGQKFIVGCGMLASMTLTVYAMKYHKLTLGDFALITSYILQISIPLDIIGFVYSQVKNSAISVGNMLDLLYMVPKIKEAPKAKILKLTKGIINFKNISFHYRKELNILKNISMEIKQNEVLAIIGKSGSGKSTIAKLLLRFYDPISGSIEIDAQNIKNVTKKSLRQQIGLVPQDTILFNNTIGFNIGYGKSNATDQEIENAAKSAALYDFILSLPDKFQTMVGERGMKLSGGERQRIGIARVIIKNPPIIIFDEATSSLDTKTESNIQNSIKKISKNHSAIVIAHRLSTVVDADQIIVLDKGKIVEKGIHAQLLNKKGLYFEMWQEQISKNNTIPSS